VTVFTVVEYYTIASCLLGLSVALGLRSDLDINWNHP